MELKSFVDFDELEIAFRAKKDEELKKEEVKDEAKGEVKEDKKDPSKKKK